jgi:hypothetical protein
MGSIADMMGSARNNSANQRMNVTRAPAPTPEVRAKQPGKLRIGVAPLRDQTGQSAFDGSALRPQLIKALERFDYDVVAADGSSDADVTADAKRKDCDYVLFNDVSAKEVSQKRKAGGFLGKAMAVGVLGPAGSAVPTGPGFDGTVAYRLFKIDQDTPELEGKNDAKGKPDQSIPATFDRETRDVASQIQKDGH